MTRDLKCQRIYRHFKGNCYYVKEVAIDSESQVEFVVYQALYGDYKTYIRKKTMFLETIDPSREDNITKQTYRFELIEV